LGHLSFVSLFHGPTVDLDFLKYVYAADFLRKVILEDDKRSHLLIALELGVDPRDACPQRLMLSLGF
jgi:hypothetical protein